MNRSTNRRNHVSLHPLTAVAVAALLGSLIVAGSAHATQSDAPVTYTVAGDSITCAPYGWDAHQPEPDGYVRVGGYCAGGKTSGQVLEGVCEAHVDADVAVILVGTNDLRFGISMDTVIANVKTTAAALDARSVLLVAVPPSNLTAYGTAKINRASQAVVLNRRLSTLAVEKGWLFTDPYITYRRMDGTWANGAAVADGVHPTDAVSTAAAHRINQAMRVARDGARP